MQWDVGVRASTLFPLNLSGFDSCDLLEFH